MRTYCRRAFSLTELLVVIAIIGVLAALMFPVFVRAKEDSKVAACMEGMKNYHRAVMLYRMDYEAAEVGNAYEMGLPTGKVSTALFVETCAPCQRSVWHPGIGNVVTPPDSNQAPYAKWEPYVRKYGDSALILHTFNFNDLSDIKTYGSTIRGIGITLGGWVVSKRKLNEGTFTHLWFHD